MEETSGEIWERREALRSRLSGHQNKGTCCCANLISFQHRKDPEVQRLKPMSTITKLKMSRQSRQADQPRSDCQRDTVGNDDVTTPLEMSRGPKRVLKLTLEIAQSTLRAWMQMDWYRSWLCTYTCKHRHSSYSRSRLSTNILPCKHRDIWILGGIRKRIMPHLIHLHHCHYYFEARHTGWVPSFEPQNRGDFDMPSCSKPATMA